MLTNLTTLLYTKSIWSCHECVINHNGRIVLTCLITVPSIISSKLIWDLPASNTLKFVLSRFKLSLLHKNQEFKSHTIICFIGNIRYCFATNKNICVISKQVKFTVSTTILDLDIVHIYQKQERSKNAPLGYTTVNIRDNFDISSIATYCFLLAK